MCALPHAVPFTGLSEAYIQDRCGYSAHLDQFAMQELLDFVHDNSLEAHFYCVLSAGESEFELYWSRSDSPFWEVRETGLIGPSRRVAQPDLLGHLRENGVDLRAFETELRASIAAQIGAANALLTEAQRLLGPETLDAMIEGQKRFSVELSRLVTTLLAPRLEVVSGEGQRTRARVGHLALVR